MHRSCGPAFKDLATLEITFAARTITHANAMPKIETARFFPFQVMTKADRFVLTRFALKSALLTLFALIGVRGSFLPTFSALFFCAAFLNVGLAVQRKDQVRGRRLSYWDEAAASCLIAVSTLILSG